MAEDQLFGQVAPVLAAIVLFEHGELVEDVGGVVVVEPVEVEEQGVEAGAELAPLGRIPGEGVAVMAKVAGERRQVARGVTETQHVVPDQFSCCAVTEGPVEAVGCDHRELLHDVPVHVRALSLELGDEVQREAAEVRRQACPVHQRLTERHPTEAAGLCSRTRPRERWSRSSFARRLISRCRESRWPTPSSLETGLQSHWWTPSTAPAVRSWASACCSSLTATLRYGLWVFSGLKSMEFARWSKWWIMRPW